MTTVSYHTRVLMLYQYFDCRRSLVPGELETNARTNPGNAWNY